MDSPGLIKALYTTEAFIWLGIHWNNLRLKFTPALSKGNIKE